MSCELVGVRVGYQGRMYLCELVVVILDGEEVKDRI